MDCRLLFVHRGRVYDHLWDWDFKKSINSFNRYLFSIHCVWGTLLDTIFLEFMGQWSKQIFLQRNAHTNIHLILKPLGKEPWRRWRTQSCCWNHVCAMHFPHLVIYTTAAAGCRLEIAAIATRRGRLGWEPRDLDQPSLRWLVQLAQRSKGKPVTNTKDSRVPIFIIGNIETS